MQIINYKNNKTNNHYNLDHQFSYLINLSIQTNKLIHRYKCYTTNAGIHLDYTYKKNIK